ncbi:META domain-containing protein [Marinobacter sp. HL-58]|uniref:META domain-containing protein n=1 Tax=Marinobacter sp. HL-58 TaxID=1479237 RepID=UPI000482BBD0|nr:META domain-containing protein [Marinobacter sp. HL-58]KPQ02871.1 MAG: Heat shock protein [Marinobacter sp. HL-58]
MNGFARTIVPALAILALIAGCSSTAGSKDNTDADSPAPGAIDLPFTAAGNEPFWRATVEQEQLVLERMGESPVELRYKTTHSDATGRTFRAEADGLQVTLAAAHQLCIDSMTGMPHPNQVRLNVNGEEFRGCGGDPEQLLRGSEWTVEYIDGAGVMDDSRITIDFLAQQRAAGHASCNQFSGGWKLTGEGLGFSRLITTKKACAPALMDQESRFLALLSDTARFEIGKQGELRLISRDGRVITAFQSTE